MNPEGNEEIDDFSLLCPKNEIKRKEKLVAGRKEEEGRPENISQKGFPSSACG